MVLTGAGHGTYLPLSACASPTILGAVLPHGGDNAFLLGLFLAPFYWALLAWIATGSHSRRRVILLSLLFVQYLGAAVFMWWSSEDSSVFAKVMDELPLTLGLFVGVYLLAQLLLWRSVIRAGMSLNAI